MSHRFGKHYDPVLVNDTLVFHCLHQRLDQICQSLDLCIRSSFLLWHRVQRGCRGAVRLRCERSNLCYHNTIPEMRRYLRAFGCGAAGIVSITLIASSVSLDPILSCLIFSSSAFGVWTRSRLDCHVGLAPLPLRSSFRIQSHEKSNK